MKKYIPTLTLAAMLISASPLVLASDPSCQNSWFPDEFHYRPSLAGIKSYLADAEKITGSDRSTLHTSMINQVLTGLKTDSEAAVLAPGIESIEIDTTPVIAYLVLAKEVATACGETYDSASVESLALIKINTYQALSYFRELEAWINKLRSSKETNTLTTQQLNIIEASLRTAKNKVLPFFSVQKEPSGPIEINLQDIQYLKDNLNDTQYKEFESNHENSVTVLYETKAIEEQEAIVVSKKALSLEKEEYNMLLNKITLGLADDKEFEKFTTLRVKLKVTSQGEISESFVLRNFSDYPEYSDRFYIGASWIAQDKRVETPRATLGYVYYIKPKIGGYFHNSIDVGISSITTEKVSAEEDDAGQETKYSFVLEHKLFGSFRDFDTSKKYHHGFIVSPKVSVFDFDDGNGDKLMYLPSLSAGYRWASSPEQYIDIAHSKCYTLTKIDNFHCGSRAQIDLRTMVQNPLNFAKDSAIQLGVSLDLKLKESDTVDNSITFSARYRTSFDDLYKTFTASQ